MNISDHAFEVESRKALFRRLMPFYTKVLPAAFFKRPEPVLNFPQLHNLIEGIFKPANAHYTLCVASMLHSPYPDKLAHTTGGTWKIEYSPKAGDLNGSANTGMFRAMADRMPVLVIRQETNKTSPSGSSYRLLGLGILESYDQATRLFLIRGMKADELVEFLKLDEASEWLPTALKLETLEEWQPFVSEDKRSYMVTSQKRDDAFRDVVLDAYDFTCAVTGQRFKSDRLVEAQAAHIIAKEKKGTDDPRNGLSLSRSVHWAFDAGIFTISDQYEVLINPKAKLARIQNFSLFEVDRKPILLPKDGQFRPHLDALAWHKEAVFDRFAG